MKLYHAPFSHNCFRVRVVINHLDLDVELHEVDLTGDPHQHEALKAINPNAMVPALVAGNLRLWESNAINQYLCDLHGNTELWPADIALRADISRWQCWQLAHWGPILDTLIWENFIKPMLGRGEPDQARLVDALNRLQCFGNMLENHLQHRTWLAGDHPTLAELAVAAPLIHAHGANIPLFDFPQIDNWFERLQQLPAWQQALPKPIAA